ncbi:hypothetical protein [Maribacter sp. 2-571]|uniref:hypothetical protein n=1 Tax=Maribacter sp. 2-571 TaxID=3417569 RepID=UPI003D334E01
MVEEINRTTNKLISALNNVQENGAKQYFRHDFDCAFFKDWNLTDIRNSEEHKDLFQNLGAITGPVVYWFEILSDTNTTEIRDCLLKYKHSEEAKAVPALKKKFNKESRILYVGKVKRNFWGRVIQHLGYYKVKRTQGLQLYYWAKELGLKIRLHAYEFEPEMEDLVAIFELKLARHFKPITGKH